LGVEGREARVISVYSLTRTSRPPTLNSLRQQAGGTICEASVRTLSAGGELVPFLEKTRKPAMERTGLQVFRNVITDPVNAAPCLLAWESVGMLAVGRNGG